MTDGFLSPTADLTREAFQGSLSEGAVSFAD